MSMIIEQVLGEEAESRKEEIHDLRNIPVDLMNKVKEAGLVKLWAAKKYGGQEAPVSRVAEVLQTLAYHNGSLAWVTGVTGCSALFSGFLEESKAEVLYTDPMTMIGGFAGPAGLATQVDGGLKVSGHWSWGSGITHCTHIVGGAMIKKEEDILGTALIFFLPEEIEMIDNWQVLGLRGTHSIDYKVDDLFIPDDRWSWFPIKKAVIDQPLYRFSFLGALSISIASVGLGIAKRAVDELVSFSKLKSPFGQGKPLSARPEYQMQIAEVYGKYLAAAALFKETIEKAEREVLTGPCSIEMKANIRLASAQATDLAHQAVQGAYKIAGGSSIWDSSKFSELIRDMNVVTQHGMVSQGNMRTAGAVLLGNKVPEVML